MSLKEYILSFLHFLERWVKSDYFYVSLFLLFSLWCFIKLTFDVITRDEITYYDRVIVEFVNKIAANRPTNPAIFITHFGSEYVPFILLLISLVLFYFRRVKEILLLILSTGGGSLLVALTKNIVDRTRPVVLTPIIHAVGYSYPSGHSTISACFYGALIYILFTNVKNKWIKSISISLLILLILLVGFSRIYLGVHYPSDVLGGFSLGIFWVSLLVLLFKKYSRS